MNCNTTLNEALIEASKRGNLNHVQALVEMGADVNCRAKTGPSDMKFGDFAGETPLHVAAADASVETIQTLLAHGADKTIRNFLGMSPYDFAVMHKRSEDICQLLHFEEEQPAEDSSPKDSSYIDEKGRTRWHQNDEIALRLLELHTFLIIADYPEDHASRYPRLAHSISRFPEPMSDLIAQGRLIEEIPGVGETIAKIIEEFLDTDTSEKLEEFAGDTPRTVVELVPIPGLGAKTIKRLYEEIGVDSLISLRTAIDKGSLKGFRGIGKKTLEKIEAYLDTAL